MTSVTAWSDPKTASVAAVPQSAPAETESRQRRTGLKLRKATKMKTARSTQESEPRRFMSRSA